MATQYLIKQITIFSSIFLMVSASYGDSNDDLKNATTASNYVESLISQSSETTEYVVEEARIEIKSDKLNVEVRNFVYELELIPKDETLAKEFLSLTEVEKEAFQQTRLTFLKRVASMLHFSKLTIGFGSVTKNKIKQIITSFLPKQDGSELPKDSEIRLIVERQIEEQRLALIQKQEFENKENVGKSKAEVLNLKGQAIISGILKAMDNILFQQARLVSNSNEFGFTAAVGPTLAAGFKKKTAGGIRDLAINIGFDKTTKALIFEVQLLSENLKEAFTPVAIVGLDIRSGMYFKNNTKGLTHSGYSFYPPGIPTGMSVYPAYFEAGVASGAALPPILTDMYSFTNDSERTALVRVEFSSIYKFFFKIKPGTVPGSWVYNYYRVSDLMRIMSGLNPRTGALVCRGLFAN